MHALQPFDGATMLAVTDRPAKAFIAATAGFTSFLQRSLTLHDSGGLEGTFAFWPYPPPDLGSPFGLV